jgi:fatty acid desaturase
MKKNLGIIDRVIRILIAVVVAVLYFKGIISGTLGIILLILAAVFVLTSFFSFCPIYWTLGLSSRPKE